MNTQDHIKEAQRQARPVEPKVRELIASVQSVILGTVDTEGNPNSSYAPYVEVGGVFYVLVSFMARHTKNLINGKPVSVLFIEDESETKQVYARHRLTVEARTSQVERDTAEWNQITAALKERHGKILDILVDMTDFILVGLHPVKGAYVNGFGSAYFVDENLEIIQHRNDINHETKK